MRPSAHVANATSCVAPLRLCGEYFFLLVYSASILAQTKRLVIIKCDGLPLMTSSTGSSSNAIRNPARAYCPGSITSSINAARALELLRTRHEPVSAFVVAARNRQHLQIKGNVEFDRYTLHSYDYLNFLSALYQHRRRPRRYARRRSARLAWPAYAVRRLPHNERYITIRSFCGIRVTRHFRAVCKIALLKSPKELFDEWTMGFETRNVL